MLSLSAASRRISAADPNSRVFSLWWDEAKTHPTVEVNVGAGWPLSSTPLPSWSGRFCHQCKTKRKKWEDRVFLSKIKKISKFTFKQANSLFLLSWFWPLSTKTCSKNNIHSLGNSNGINHCTLNNVFRPLHHLPIFWASRWILCDYIFIATAQSSLWSLMCRCHQNKGVKDRNWPYN